MRTEQEIMELITEQIIHWVKNCGRDECELADMVLEAEDMIVTDEEMWAYPNLGNHIKMSIIL